MKKLMVEEEVNGLGKERRGVRGVPLLPDRGEGREMRTMTAWEQT